jgi:hypothetical protein
MSFSEGIPLHYFNKRLFHQNERLFYFNQTAFYFYETAFHFNRTNSQNINVSKDGDIVLFCGGDTRFEIFEMKKYICFLYFCSLNKCYR